MSDRPLPRIFAGVFGIALLAPLGVGALLVWFFAEGVTERPDPFVPDGDPCCGHPDDKGDLVAAAAGATVVAAADALLLAAVLVLLYRAARGGTPRARWVALPPAALFAAAAATIAVLLVRAPDGPPVDCEHARLNRLAWNDGFDGAQRQALEIDRCGTLIGATPARVRALLGPPEATHTDGKRYWSYTYLELRFDRGRVDHARAGII